MLKKISSHQEIPDYLLNTPIEKLIKYHNLNQEHDKYAQPELLIGMCMDNRKVLNIPSQFAFILRTGGANLRYSEFKMSYAIGVGGVKYVALIGHSQCGMVNLVARKETFVNGLMERAGWDKKRAEEHFLNYAPMFEIENEVDFVWEESKRLKRKYPKIFIVPFLYKVEDNKLYLIENT